MPFLIGLIILTSALIPTYNFISNKTKNNQSPKIERVQNYTMDQLKLSTLSEKYGDYDYPGETEIEFNGCKYKVIDNKSGGRKFEPKDNCPPLILTPISYERFQEIINSKITPRPNIVKDYPVNNVVQNKSNNNQNFNENNLNNNLDHINPGYVRCHFPHSGVLILKKEECDRLIDCQIDDNTWTPLTKQECEKKQKDIVDEKTKEFEKYLDSLANRNYQIPTLPSIPTFGSSNFYKDLEALRNENRKIYENYSKELEELRNETIKKMQESITNTPYTDPYRSYDPFKDCLNRLGERGRELCERIYRR